MGNTCSYGAPVSPKTEIDKLLEKAQEEEKLNLKILLLGINAHLILVLIYLLN
jgi:hypothetical protein